MLFSGIAVLFFGKGLISPCLQKGLDTRLGIGEPFRRKLEINFTIAQYSYYTISPIRYLNEKHKNWLIDLQLG